MQSDWIVEPYVSRRTVVVAAKRRGQKVFWMTGAYDDDLEQECWNLILDTEMKAVPCLPGSGILETGCWR